MSGRTIAECHARDVVYPGHFLCVCHSGQAFSDCVCGQRGHPVLEHYDQRRRRIVSRFRERPTGIPPELRDRLAAQRARLDVIANFCAITGLTCPTDYKVVLEGRQVAVARELARAMIERGELDRSVGYAMDRVDAMPR